MFPAVMLLLAPLALAHIPHDTVLSLVAPADGDAGQTWFSLLDPQGVYLWARSDDGGASWVLDGGDPLSETPLGAARTDDGTVAILTEEHLWISTDDALSWSAEELPGEVSDIQGGPVFEMAGPGGLFFGKPGQWTRVTEAPVSKLGPGAAWAPSEGMWIVVEGAWTLIDGPLATPESLSADATAYYGDAEGVVYRWDGAAWIGCTGLIDNPGEEERNDVVQLLATDGSLFAATGTAAPFVAPASCSAFSDAALAPIEIEYGNDGGAATERDAWTGLHLVGDTLALTGWAGLAFSHDGGESWAQPQVVPPDYTRGLAFARGFPADPRIYVGAYAAGIQVSADGGLTWTSPNHGVEPVNAQWVEVSPSEDGVVYSVINHIGWVSRDGGVSWEEFQSGRNAVGLLQPLQAAGRVWELDSDVWETRDGGQSWEELEGLTAVLEGGVVGLAEAEGWLCVSQAEPSALLCSEDDGASWTRLTEGADSGISTHPILWPAEAPTRALFGDAAGVHVAELDGGGGTVEIEALSKIELAPDGTLIAGANSGSLYTSSDGGDSWEPLGVRVPAHIQVMRARPDWDSHPELLVGTQDGVFVVGIDGSWGRLAYERLDNTSNYLVCEGCVDAITDEEAEFDNLQPLGEGATLSAQVRGQRLVISGVAEDGAGFALDIDGEEFTVGPLPAGRGVLVELELAEDGWHDLVFTGLAGAEVALDTVELWGDGRTLEVPGAETGPTPLVELSGASRDADQSRCGCGSDASAAGLLLLLGWRRRR